MAWKRFRMAALAAAALVATAQAGFAAPPPNDGLRLVDLTGKFDAVATSTANLDDAARVAAFEKAMDGVADGFYARSRKPDRYDSRVLKNLAAYPDQRAAILDVSRGESGLSAETRQALAALDKPVHVQVFSTPT